MVALEGMARFAVLRTTKVGSSPMTSTLYFVNEPRGGQDANAVFKVLKSQRADLSFVTFIGIRAIKNIKVGEEILIKYNNF